jgi:NADH-quinone oxidoreductase subunit J
MTLLYALLAGLVVAASVLILLTPHVLYAALGLLCVLLGMAAIYFLQGASFVAVAHVIVYGSTVLVLVMFSALLLPLGSQPTIRRSRWILGGLVTGLFGGCLWPLVRFAMHTLQQQDTVNPPQTDAITGLGLQLLGPYALAFEWIGLNLLIALVGAAYTMKQ